jgi:hypothetical protein
MRRISSTSAQGARPTTRLVEATIRSGRKRLNEPADFSPPKATPPLDRQMKERIIQLFD